MIMDMIFSNPDESNHVYGLLYTTDKQEPGGRVIRREQMKTSPIINAAFVGSGSLWGLKPLPSAPSYMMYTSNKGLSIRNRSSARGSLHMMHGGVIDATVGPDLMAQLAGCVALVGTGKYFQGKEEEEERGVPSSAKLWSEDSRAIEKEVDLYRDTWVRYFGYFNEVGEAFRPIIPTIIVTFSYLVAFAYIAADSYSQGKKVTCTQSGQWKLASIIAAIDSLLFQIMASVIFPSFIINRWVTFSVAMLNQMPDTPDYFDYLPTATGLLVIPLICPPLDVLTHRLLDGTFRVVSETLVNEKEA